MKGIDLQNRENELRNERLELDKETLSKINKIKQDLISHINTCEIERNRSKRLFENSIIQKRDELQIEIQIALSEIEKVKLLKRKELLAIEKEAKDEFGEALFYFILFYFILFYFIFIFMFI